MSFPVKNNPSENGWGEYRKLVLKELESLGSVQEKVRAEVVILREEIATLKVKAGVWGLVGGLIPVAVALVYALLQKGH